MGKSGKVGESRGGESRGQATTFEPPSMAIRPSRRRNNLDHSIFTFPWLATSTPYAGRTPSPRSTRTRMDAMRAAHNHDAPRYRFLNLSPRTPSPHPCSSALFCLCSLLAVHFVFFVQKNSRNKPNSPFVCNIRSAKQSQSNPNFWLFGAPLRAGGQFPFVARFQKSRIDVRRKLSPA